MRLFARISLSAVVVFAIAASAGPLFAQTSTTGTLSGTVFDEQGGVLPGADVVGVHVPTGTTYETVTGGDGRFQLLNVRVGGPYTVTVRLSGFRDQEQQGITVALAEETKANFKLPLQSVAETVTVTAEASSIFTGSKSGAGTSIETLALENLPTLNRGLADFARLSPFVNTNPDSAGQTLMSIGGRQHRYNNIQIDGAVNNDIFGVSESTTPGGGAESQPISLDAIQELQVSVSPYDVRQGGFTGGGINAITRSGSNDFHGTGYYYWRDDGLVGKGPTETPVGTFKDKEGGVSVGGPILQNRAFFFTNVELGRKSTPSGYSADGQSGIPFGLPADAQRIRDVLRARYGYEAGGLEQFIRDTPNNKVFVRGDLNLGTHQVTLRHNYIDAGNDRGFPSATFYLLPENYYRVENKTHSSVGQINSTFGTAYNEFRLSFQTIRDRRGGRGEPFPAIDVRTQNGAVTWNAGTEFSSQANELDQDIFELNDDFTLVKGSHTFTIGTHNEFFQFRNFFIQNLFGSYRFDSIDLLEQGLAQSFNHGFSATSDPRQSAEFSIRQFGVYGGDQWRVRPNLTVTYGVRLDYPVFPDKPTQNPISEQLFGYRTDEVPSSPLWSPRVGFNLDLSGEKRQQLRGGIGLFSGRTPYVWLANQYSNTGTLFTRLSASYLATRRLEFVPDPFNQPKSIAGVGAGINEINMVDPDYKFPSLLRGNIGFDRELFWNMNGTAEVIWGETVNDIDYKNLNFAQVGTAFDGRPRYARVNTTLSEALLLTNTSKGNQWSVAFKVDRPFRNGFYAGASDMYNDSRSVSDGTSSTAGSQWANVRTLDPNNVPETRSHWAVGNRLTLSGSYAIPMGRGFSSTVSLFYNGQSGRTYSVTFFNDVNGDTRTSNDLLYVPRTADEIIVTNGTWTDLDNYINNDACLSDRRGTFAPRNCGRGPWINTLDFRFDLGIPAGGGRKADFTFDLVNLLNLFDGNNGVVLYPDFWNLQAVGYGGIDAASGKPIYNVTNIVTRPKFTTDNLRSRWQGKFGLRFRF